ncbi:MAG: EF2563 family selenium-dependent molybdenum hydroxylase system protein [Acidimicrobiaceae bacterium]|nr:EF2563 family selenium-dependent molybdenum hydroxylase system protein [Acidimicrobiaceae bacterium]MYG99721.1 EF2563 family selenium-dependent molybdenum hydroxylase system protein [Acidimicrobiaceae bacterium]MYL03061.1 EF2563 family selenium-dependent molybdenum hydroxylase system protein [Acidimicrobiaceae bacterium]
MAGREPAGDGSSPLCVLRGGGDLATGVAWRLTRAGWPVVVLELPEPLTIRRTVALSTAVTDGEISVQGMRGVRAASPPDAAASCERGDVPVLVSPDLADLGPLQPDVVVDARLAKRNMDTSIDDAGIVIGLGPGFTAGTDCHAVVETMRGHLLGRVIWSGSALPDTGTPAELGGRSADRVMRAPAPGEVLWHVGIGDSVSEGQLLGEVGGAAISAPFDGVLRGAIRPGTTVPEGLKIGDVDPRCDPSACWEISDKSLAVGGGVLEAVLARLSGLA